ncbi:MAG: hypothetical protein FWF08_00240 [Oscillospiraceae bacterium]|nr:hypothetical protein [Oscillospiraceae bacterium]
MLSKIIAIILALWTMIAGLFGFGPPKPADVMKDCYPIVFVHGLGGWGEGAALNNVLPHWGMFAGNMSDYLASEGYETYAVSVGPVSSAWDRACELYAQLAGATVDYGAAHSAEHGHNRYGLAYEKLVPEWDAENKIHMIGHSFGGATVRLFTQLCEEGSAVEIADAAADISPLFTGELSGSIASITTLAAPHNGAAILSPAVESGSTGALDIAFGMLVVMGELVPEVNRIYPFRLEHFGMSNADLRRDPIGTVKKYSAFNSGTDNSNYDLSIDGAYALNQTIDCQSDIYYFSFVGQKSEPDDAGNYIPKSDMWFFFKEPSKSIGLKHEPFLTDCGIIIDDSWLPNDGLVSVVSAEYPFSEPYKTYDENNIEKGKWQVMPLLEDYDHLDFAGGMKIGGTPGIKDFYLNIAQILESISD